MRFPAYFIALIALMIIVLLALFPHEGFAAAVRGVSIWWDVLFPALFPFFVISEMLLGFGIVHFLGTLLDPMMRPVFRVPGIGGFVMAMGFASGYPVGARLTSQLWDQKLIRREEGERLVAFTTSADPIFLIGAVSVGFFHDASLAGILAVAHYGGSVIVGLFMRFHGDKGIPEEVPQKAKGSIWPRAFQAMHKARVEDGRSIGILLNQAIQHSLNLIFVVGGLVVFFSVALEVLTAGHIMHFFYLLIHSALQIVGIPPSLSIAVINGLFEVTLGAKSAGSSGSDILLVNKTAIAAFVLSWGGLSVHAQIVSLLSHTNLRYAPFVIARLLHGLISAILVIILWKPMLPLRGEISAFLPQIDASSPLSSFLRIAVPTGGLLFVSAIAVIICLFISHFLLKKIYKQLVHPR